MSEQTKRSDEVRFHTTDLAATGRASRGLLSHLALGLLLAFAAVGCSTVGGDGGAPGTAEPTLRWDLTGTWEGRVEAGGTPIEGALSIEQTGSTLVASFASPALGLLAEGDGFLEEDGDVVLEMEYDLECPGRATLDGRVSEDGDTLRGTVDASDCTGSMTGSFTFTR